MTGKYEEIGMSKDEGWMFDVGKGGKMSGKLNIDGAMMQDAE